MPTKKEMLDYICGDSGSSRYDELLWEVYTLKAEINDRVKNLEQIIWELKENEEESD
tara:strand:+ start:536 stop:706 length:171 start_codon:yes stop_codon:yes gene_type:complete